MSSPKLLGVCAWLAYRFDLDVVGVRWAFILGTIFTVGSPILLYLIVYLIMPKNQRI